MDYHIIYFDYLDYYNYGTRVLSVVHVRFTYLDYFNYYGFATRVFGLNHYIHISPEMFDL